MSREDISVSDPRRWAMFVILLVGAFLPPLDFFIINVALPSVRQDLGASASAEQLVISVYAGLYAVTLITGGRLGDIYGRGRMFFLGLIGFAAASLLCGCAWSPWALIAGRALQGVTAAVMAPQALASVQAIFPDAEKPLALSLYGAVFGLASVIGQALGGILISLDVMGLVRLIIATPTGVQPVPLLLALILFIIGFGQGLGMPTLMRMVTGRVAPAYSGMIAGIASSTLQISTALSVAVVGGIFYTILGADTDPSAITHAFIIALLCIALCLGAGMLLSITLVRQAAAPVVEAGANAAGVAVDLIS